MTYSHLFGPVQSRRLGISLGVDMVPGKICTLNCVYCECGETEDITLQRKEYISVQDLTSELSDYLCGNPHLDYVTFAGSGEPTLNTSLGSVIRFVKENYPSYKTALLTNGTLLYIPEVRESILLCDLVLPSLDAISEKAFSLINRPHGSLDNDLIIEGLSAFSRQYNGLLWIEVFIVPGINDNPDELHAFREALLKINPTRVQINSLDRPGACDWVHPADPQTLQEIARFFSPLPVEIISRNSRNTVVNELPDSAVEETIYSLLRRRPSTVEELSSLSGIIVNQISLLLEALISRGKIETYNVGGREFFRGKT